MNRAISRSHNEAFTLVEMLAVIGIITIMLAVAALGFRSFAKSSRRSAAAGELLGVLEQARTHALSATGPVYVAFATDTAPEPYRYRAYGVFAEDHSGERRPILPWRFLSEGVAFEAGPGTLLTAPRERFRFPQTQTEALCPFVKFEASGRVSSPPAARLRIPVVEAVTSATGGQIITARGPDGKPLVDEIRIHHATGRARYVSPAP